MKPETSFDLSDLILSRCFPEMAVESLRDPDTNIVESLVLVGGVPKDPVCCPGLCAFLFDESDFSVGGSFFVEFRLERAVNGVGYSYT